MSIIETIRAEVERLKEEIYPVKVGEQRVNRGPTSMESAALGALNTLMSRISTLQEKSEKPINSVLENMQGTTAKASLSTVNPKWPSKLHRAQFAKYPLDHPLCLDNNGNPIYVQEQPVCLYDGGTPSKEKCGKCSTICSVRVEQPVCEVLEEEITKWFAELDKKYGVTIDYGCADIEETARHFYELGRKSKPKVSEDLEEQGKIMADSLVQGLPIECAKAIPDIKECIVIAVRHGAFWQKERMMKQLRSYCLGEITRFPESNDASRATRETYYDIIGYLDKNYGCK